MSGTASGIDWLSSLDASFLRAYENGQPVATPQHLTWSPRAPVDGGCRPSSVIRTPASFSSSL